MLLLLFQSTYFIIILTVFSNWNSNLDLPLISLIPKFYSFSVQCYRNVKVVQKMFEYRISHYEPKLQHYVCEYVYIHIQCCNFDSQWFMHYSNIFLHFFLYWSSYNQNSRDCVRNSEILLLWSTLFTIIATETQKISPLHSIFRITIWILTLLHGFKKFIFCKLRVLSKKIHRAEKYFLFFKIYYSI